MVRSGRQPIRRSLRASVAESGTRAAWTSTRRIPASADNRRSRRAGPGLSCQALAVARSSRSRISTRGEFSAMVVKSMAASRSTVAGDSENPVTSMPPSVSTGGSGGARGGLIGAQFTQVAPPGDHGGHGDERLDVVFRRDQTREQRPQSHPQKADAGDTGVLFQGVNRGDDVIAPMRDLVAIRGGACGIARARIIESKRRDAARGNRVRERANAPMCANRLVTERLANHQTDVGRSPVRRPMQPAEQRFVVRPEIHGYGIGVHDASTIRSMRDELSAWTVPSRRAGGFAARGRSVRSRQAFGAMWKY